MKAFRLVSLLATLTLVALGCGGGGDGGGGTDGGTTDTGGTTTGSTYFFVLSELGYLANEPDGTRWGFNLDGVNTAAPADDICLNNQMDYTSPSPDREEGVDNAGTGFMESLDTQFQVTDRTQANINDGDFVLLFQVEGVDDLINDDNVTLRVMLGKLPEGATTTLDGDRLAAGQTFDVDTMASTAVVPNATITNGRLTAGPADIRLEIPFDGDTLGLDVRKAQIRFNIAEGSFDTGVLGGQLNIDELITAIETVAAGQGESNRALIEGFADLDLDEATGICQAISIAVTVDGTGAVRGADR